MQDVKPTLCEEENMSAATQTDFLSSIVSLLPEEHVNDRVRSRLKKLQERLDNLFFLDETSELAVDRQALIALARDEDFVPADLRDVVILETAKHLGRRLKGVGKGHRITWLEGGKYGPPTQPAVDELRKSGLKPSMSTQELGVALREWYPKLPKDFLASDSSKLYPIMLANLAHNRTVWDCVVANLGWWAAINVIGTLIIALVMLGSGVPWPWVLAACIAFSGFLTAFVILSCATNPEWHF
jgi:hypothetical protein